jgi:hypothetical protein
LNDQSQQPQRGDIFVVEKNKKQQAPSGAALSFPRKGGQGAENLRKKNRHVHEYEEDLR